MTASRREDAAARLADAAQRMAAAEQSLAHMVDNYRATVTVFAAQQAALRRAVAARKEKNML